MLRTVARLTGLGCVLAAIAAPVSAAAPFGADDASFSGDGWHAMAAGSDTFASASVLLQDPGGNLVSGGEASEGGAQVFALTRHSAGGILDAGFGTGGRVLRSIGNGGRANIAALTRRPDGRIVAAGTAIQGGDRQLAVLQLTGGGQPDSGFDGDGVLLRPVGTGADTQGQAAATAADGDVLVAGTAKDGAAGKLFVARLNPDGSLDSAFGVDGVRLLNIGLDGLVNAVAIREEAGGAITVLGDARTDNIEQAFVARLTASGARDASFGTDGVVLRGIDGRRVPVRTGAWDAEGRILLAAPTVGGPVMFSQEVIRLTPDGAYDTSFSGDGRMQIVDVDIRRITRLVPLPDGRIAVGMAATQGSLPIIGAFGTAIVTAAGTLDSTYGGDGIVFDVIGSGRLTLSDELRGLVFDGTHLVSAGHVASQIFDGSSLAIEERRFGLVRYELDGDRSPGWGTANGVTTTRLGVTTTTFANGGALTASDEVLVAGAAVQDGERRAAAWRLTAGGVPDAAFGGGDGAVLLDPGSRGSSAVAILPLAGDKTLLGGRAVDAGVPATFVTRLAADGTHDPSWAGGGTALVRLDGPTTETPAACAGTPVLCRDDDGVSGIGGEFTQLLALADGDFLALGYAGSTETFGDLNRQRAVIARFNPDGTLDSGFGTGGIVQYYRQGRSNAYALPAREVPAGKVVVPVAFWETSTGGDFGIIRIDAATGALDASYSGDGYATVAHPSVVTRAHSSLVLADGSAFLAAVGGDFPNTILLTRMAADGSLDTTFGTGGFANHAQTGLSMQIHPSTFAQLPDGTLSIPAFTNVAQPLTTATFGFSTPAGAPVADYGASGLLTTARSCGAFNSRSSLVDSTGRLVVIGSGRDLALGGAIGVRRYVAGSPSPPVPCPPLDGSVFLTGTSTLTCVPQSFTGAAPITFTYEWLREKTVIDGATAVAYTPTDADAGHLLACRATASNAHGTRRVISFPRRVPGTPFIESEDGGSVTPPPPPPPPPPPGATAPPPAAATPPPAGNPPPVAPKPAPAIVPPKLKPADVFTLPSTRKCVSRRKFRIRLRSPRGGKLASAQVFVNAKRVRTISGKRLTAPIDLRGLPKGRVKVKVTARTTDGRTVTEMRTYRTCAAGKR